MRIRFAMVTEGSSDRGLVPHLEELCLRAGATEVEGVAPDLGLLPAPPGKRVADQVRAVLKLVPGSQLIFVHRDADQRDEVRARQEIAVGIAELESCPAHVEVIPIQALESWLLTDESAIRELAMNPKGTAALELPPVSGIERAANPKDRLRTALVAASTLGGRRLRRFKQQFPQHRAILLERLDIDGDVRQLESWARLVGRVTAVVQRLIDERPEAPAPAPR